MQRPRTVLSARNKRSTNRKKGFKDFHFVDQIPFYSSTCFLDDFISSDYSFEDLMKYTEFIQSTFLSPDLSCHLEKYHFNEKMPLIYLTNAMEDLLTTDSYWYQVNLENDIYSFERLEHSGQMYGYLYFFNMNFINKKIPMNIKIGLSKIYKKLNEFFEFPNVNEFIETSSFYEHQGFIKHSAEYEECGDVEAFDDLAYGEECFLGNLGKLYHNYKGQMKKIFDKVQRLSEKEFDSLKIYSKDKDKEVMAAINKILDFNFNIIKSERRNDDIEGHPIDSVFSFIFEGISDELDIFFSKYLQFKLNDYNDNGAEWIPQWSKVSSDGSYEDNTYNLALIDNFERNLAIIIDYIQTGKVKEQ